MHICRDSDDPFINDVQRVDTVAHLRLVPMPRTRMVMVTEGKITPGDGDGHFYYWDSTSLLPDDGELVVAITDQITGRWLELIFSTDLTGLDIENVGGGVGIFLDRVINTFDLKTLVPGPGAGQQVTDLGEQIQLEVTSSAASSYDIVFTNHGGNFHQQSPRATLSNFASGENIARLTIITPYPIDTTELKASIRIDMAGRMAVALTPADAQKIYANGIIRIDREGGNFITGTPSFDGDCSSGLRMQVGSISGFMSVEITFRLGASAREIQHCIVSGTAYSAATVTQTYVLNINGTAITGGTDVYGCSGLRALTVTAETSQTVPVYFESRGRWLMLYGQVVNTGNWANNSVLWNMPDPYRPRNGNLLALFTALASGLPAGQLLPSQLTFGTNGNVVLAANYSINNMLFNGMTPLDLRSF